MTIDEVDALETEICAAVHDEDADVERLAHLVAGSERAQVYLVELVGTLSALAPRSPAIDRAEALLEHGLAVAAHHGGEPPTSAEGGAERAGARG